MVQGCPTAAHSRPMFSYCLCNTSLPQGACYFLTGELVPPSPFFAICGDVAVVTSYIMCTIRLVHIVHIVHIMRIILCVIAVYIYIYVCIYIHMYIHIYVYKALLC